MTAIVRRNSSGYLVASSSGTALPEVSASDCGAICVTILGVLRGDVVLPVHLRGAASEEDDNGTEEQADHGSDKSPHAGREISVASTSIVIDVALDDAEKNKVGSHNNNCDYPSHCGNDSSQKSTADTRASCSEESNESQGACDRVEDHDSCEAFGSVDLCTIEIGVVGCLKERSWVVANVLASAVIVSITIKFVSCVFFRKERAATYAASRRQYPNVPNVTCVSWELVPFASLTFMIAIWSTTGLEMVVIKRRIVAAKRRNVPMWWKKPVFAILKFG